MEQIDPWVSKFVSECPPSADLSEDVFSVALSVRDQFNTLVSGPYLIDNGLSITMTSDSSPTLESSIDPSSGTYLFKPWHL